MMSGDRCRNGGHAGIEAATTPLVCFTDDDAIWNANFLKWLLVPFNDDRMGGTGSNQIMRPTCLTKPPTVFERIADMRLSSRMLEAAASTFYDGSVSCLSGRTALYHKRIFTDRFAQEFTQEKWRNKCVLLLLLLLLLLPACIATYPTCMSADGKIVRATSALHVHPIIACVRIKLCLCH